MIDPTVQDRNGFYKFSHFLCCPKCHYSSFSIRYHRGGWNGTTETPEHLKKECNTCGFDWYERTADSH